MMVVGTPAVTEHVWLRFGNGPVGTGAVTSFTVTVKLVLVPSGLLVQVTSVSPPGKNEPDGWSQVTVPQSVAPTSKVTLAPQALAALSTTIGTAGGVKAQVPPVVTALTITLKVHAALVLVPSLAVHVTGVVPAAKFEPDWWLQLTTAKPAGSPGVPLSSVTLTVKLTTAPEPAEVSKVVMSLGQLMVGARLSLTVNVVVQVSPEADSKVMTLTPIGKV
jgi:hypothetical protein